MQARLGARAVEEPSRREGLTWPVLAILACIIFAACVSLTQSRVGTYDLWFDDSWVALSTRASFSRALRMGIGAPGFTVLMRWWIGLAPGSIPWAQSFALVPLLFAPFVVFAGARAAGASRVAATLVACLGALSPMLLLESARVKQYTWEYGLSAMMVALAAVTRRDGPRIRWTVLSACVAVTGVVFSFAMLIPMVLLYLVLGVELLHAARGGEARLDLRAIAGRLAVLGGAGLLVLAWAAAMLPESPPALADHWQNEFLGSSGSVSETARQAVLMVRGFWSAFVYGGSSILVIVPVALTAWFAWKRWRTGWWLLLAPLLAVILSATHRYPLGSIVKNRVVAWLMPWIAVVVALALTDLVALPAVRRALRRIPRSARIASITAAMVVLAMVVALTAKGYVPARAGVAAETVTRAAERGQPTFVTYANFPVDLLLPGPLRIVDDDNSETTFSVLFENQPRTLHVDDRRIAARELRRACGRTATIAGATPESLAPILRQVGCPYAIEHATKNGTGQPFDDTVRIRFGPRG